MSNESSGYREGLERGKAGKGDAQSIADVILDSGGERRARQRGYEAGLAAKATAEAIAARGESHASYSGGGAYDGPIFLLRRWFPNLFPWREEDASNFVINSVMHVLGISGLLLGLWIGYSAYGIGAAIVAGLVLGGVGYFIGIFLGLFGSVIVPMLLNVAILAIPVSLVGWILWRLWHMKL